MVDKEAVAGPGRELTETLESLTPLKVILKEDWDSPETNAAIAADFYDESPNE